MLMEPIIIVFIKLVGAAISDHWDLGETGNSRDYDAPVRSLGWQCVCTADTLPVGHAWLPIWMRPLTAKRANNQEENVHISNSTTPIVLTLVSGDS